MDSMLTKDRELSLLVAMETALVDERFEVSAAALCDWSGCRGAFGCWRVCDWSGLMGHLQDVQEVNVGLFTAKFKSGFVQLSPCLLQKVIIGVDA